MKLEVGQFVRTNKGIFQIRNKDVFIEDKKQYIGVNGRYTCIDIETIEKASHNIIDLVEEKDLLEIEYYSLRYGERVKRLFEVSFKDRKFINLSNGKCEFMLTNGEFNKDDKELKPIIKSIVTKEQFEAMQYEIK